MEEITGGQDATPNAYPSLVALLLCMDKLAASCTHFCGGMIYSNFWVITAAHCVMDIGQTVPIDKVVAVAGKWDMGVVEPGQQTSEVARILRHEKFVLGKRALAYDIGLVGLRTGFESNEWVHPSPLAKPAEDQDTVRTVIAGWGALDSEDARKDIFPKILQALEVEIISSTECLINIRMLEDFYNKPWRLNLVDGHVMCTGPVTGGKSGCSGDSGGPLIQYSDSKKQEIIGIISNSPEPCGSQYGATIYTKISEYIEWIERTIENNKATR